MVAICVAPFMAIPAAAGIPAGPILRAFVTPTAVFITACAIPKSC